MSNAALGLLPVVAYLATVALSVPLTLVAFAIGSISGSLVRGVVYTALTVGAALLAALLAFALVRSPAAAAIAAVTLAGAAVFLAAFPVVVGRGIVVRYTDCSPERGLRYALAGWGPALLASLVVFLVPGGVTRYDVTLASASVPPIAWMVFGGIVALGPGLAGLGLARSVGGE